MKGNPQFLICVILMLVTKAYAQDTIRFINNDVKVAKIVEINPQAIKYYKWDYLTGPMYISLRKKIYTIKYSTGRVDSFNIGTKYISTLDNKSQCDSIFLRDGRKFYASIHSIGPKSVKFKFCQPSFYPSITVHKRDCERRTRRLVHDYYTNVDGDTTGKKNKGLLIFMGLGGGFGYGSISSGYPRDLFNFDISAIYKHLFCSFRYMKSNEFTPTFSYGFVGASPDWTEVRYNVNNQCALLVGGNLSWRRFLFNAGIGISLEDNLVDIPNSQNTRSVNNTIGFPAEAQIIYQFKYFGFGLKYYYNTNSVITTQGGVLTLKMGLLSFKKRGI